MKDIEIGLFDYAFSPLEATYKESQRIVNPNKKTKIKIIGKRIIKEEKNINIIKIFRIQKYDTIN